MNDRGEYLSEYGGTSKPKAKAKRKRRRSGSRSFTWPPIAHGGRDKEYASKTNMPTYR